MTGIHQLCDAPTCGELATHEMLVQLPDVEREVFHLCRSHGQAATSIMVRRRPKLIAPPAPRGGVRRKTRRPGIIRWLVKGGPVGPFHQRIWTPPPNVNSPRIARTTCTARFLSSTMGLVSKPRRG